MKTTLGLASKYRLNELNTQANEVSYTCVLPFSTIVVTKPILKPYLLVPCFVSYKIIRVLCGVNLSFARGKRKKDDQGFHLRSYEIQTGATHLMRDEHANTVIHLSSFCLRPPPKLIIEIILTKPYFFVSFFAFGAKE